MTNAEKCRWCLQFLETDDEATLVRASGYVWHRECAEDCAALLREGLGD